MGESDALSSERLPPHDGAHLETTEVPVGASEEGVEVRATLDCGNSERHEEWNSSGVRLECESSGIGNSRKESE